MKQDKLTESAVKKAEPKTKQYKLSDGGGLYLLVHTNSSKYWRFDFRFDGKQKSSSLGVWPEVTLALARKKRDQAKKKIKEGINPIQEKKKKKSLRFEEINETVKKLQPTMPHQISQREEIHQTPQSPEKKNRSTISLLISNIYPELGEKPVSELDREDFTEILKNLYRNKKEVFQIFWHIYPDYPLVQFGVLFVLLFAAMDFFPALLTISLYLIFTVCITIAINVLNDNSDNTD